MREPCSVNSSRLDLQNGGSRVAERALIIELKRPRDTIVWDNCSQALEYRDSLRAYFPEMQFDVCIVGGKVHPLMAADQFPGVRVFAYTQLVSQARSRLNWLVANIDEELLSSIPSQP